MMIPFAVSIQLPNGMLQRWAPQAEAERMLKRGECKRLRIPGRKCVGKAKPVYRLVLEVEPSMSACTPAPITFPNMLANVGLAGNHHAVREARIKIREYRKVGQHDPMFAGAK